jgi:hypothetical protein
MKRLILAISITTVAICTRYDASGQQTWKTLLREDFGTGLPSVATNAPSLIAPGITDYTPSSNNPIFDGQYAVVKNPKLVSIFDPLQPFQWMDAGDHTSVDSTGYMMLINANPAKRGEALGSYYVFSTRSLDLPGATYRINLWAANILGAAPAASYKDGFVGLGVRNNASGLGTMYNESSVNTWILSRKTPFTDVGPLPWQNLISNFTLPLNYNDTALYFNFFNTDTGPTNITNGNDLVLDDILIEMRVVQFQGSIFNDKNGNGIVDMAESSVSTGINGLPLYVYITKENGAIISKVQVQPDGTYTFANDQGVPYSLGSIGLKLVLSSADLNEGGNITTTSISGYNVVSEINNASVSTGVYSNDGILEIISSSLDVGNINMGINRQPMAETILFNLSTQPILNTIVPLNGTGAPMLSGSDPEDQPILGPLTGKIIHITSLPTSGQLLYQGNPIVFGSDGINPPSTSNPFIISSLIATDLSVQLTGSGYTSTSFGYKYVDMTAIESPVATYSITFASPLPAILTYFDISTKDGCSLKYKWTVGSERNIINYAMEGSVEGIEFNTIKSVYPKGSNNTYSETIKLNNEGYQYFRLKMIDNDNNYQLSNTLYIYPKCNNVNTVQFFPNPFSNNIEINGLVEGDQIELMNMLGAKVISIYGNSCCLSINTSNLPSGMYIIMIKSYSGEIVAHKLTKQ